MLFARPEDAEIVGGFSVDDHLPDFAFQNHPRHRLERVLEDAPRVERTGTVLVFRI
jgi:hypothetical protein